MSKVEGWNRCAQSFFYKIDRIPYFDIRYSLFDIRYSLFQSFYSDQTGCPLAGGRAHMKLDYKVLASAVDKGLTFFGGFALFKVSFSIKLDARGQRPRSCETSKVLFSTSLVRAACHRLGRTDTILCRVFTPVADQPRFPYSKRRIAKR
jgi:hypothetical protein